MPRFQPIDWYDAPRLYDIVFAEDTELECDFLESVRKRYGGTSGRRVVEPACGSGRLLAGLTTRGYRVSGFDLNPAMVRFARERLRAVGGRAAVSRQSMESFSYGTKFDLAHCLVSTFKYLPGERPAAEHLRRVAHVLKPGGVYVLGFHLTDYDLPSRTRERWVGVRGDCRVVCNIQLWPADRRRRTERVRSRLTVTERGGTAWYETNWTFRTYDVHQVHRLLARVPCLNHVATYDFTYDPGHPIPFDGSQLDVVLVLRRE